MIKLMTKTWKWWDPCMTCDKNYAKNHGTMMKIVEKDDETWWTTHSKTMTKWWQIMSKMMKCDKKQKQCQNEEDMRSMMNYDKTMSMTLTRCWKLMRKMRTVAKPCRKQWRNDETWWENDEIWE